MASTCPRDIGLAFMGGFIAALLIVLAATIVAFRQSDVYGLGHWKLNAKMPLSSMWMNLGYWTNPEGKDITLFEDACAMLLRKILEAAGLVTHDDDTGSQGNSSDRALAVLDVGFGCGDQTWELIRLTKAAERRGFRYVGLSMNQFQVDVASRRIYLETSKPGRPPAESFSLFCADAAVPDRWGHNVRTAVETLDDDKFTDRWFLALDCLYHFSPSRKPILEHAAKKLGANLMAFELILNETASWKQVLAARAIGVMMGCPVRTFLTEAEYRRQLVECGYDEQSVIIRDISPHVFPGIVGFLDEQDRALGQYGVSIGGFKLAGRLFDWFERSRVVKASIVVARVVGSRDD